MIVYSATKLRFREDVMSNNISDVILQNFRTRTGRSTGESEINAWMDSLPYMDRVLADDGIPGDVGDAIEFVG